MTRNIALLAGYAAAALIAAALFSAARPDAPVEWIWVVAVAVLVLAGLLHEVFARSARDEELDRDLRQMQMTIQRLEDEMGWARREMRALLEALEERGHPAAMSRRPGQPNIQEVMSEVRLLRSLVERLSSNPGINLQPGDIDTEELTIRPTGKQPEVLHDLDEDQALALVRDALSHDRVDVVMQPIVTLPQRRRRFYECFTRLRSEDGSVLLPASYISVAEQAGLIAAIDNMLLFRCIQLIRRIQRRGSEEVDFFCNVSGPTLADETFFGDFVRYLGSHPELAANLVFEFPQSALLDRNDTAQLHLERLHRLGCRFSLDQVHALPIDIETLRDNHVKFVKIEAATLQKLMEEDGSSAVRSLLDQLAEARIELIVEKIEEEVVLKELLEYGIDFGQGYLFGEPRPIRPAA